MIKIGTLFTFIVFNSAISVAQTRQNTELELNDLSGKWYIHLTNFPMWLKGDKTRPTFNYTVDEKNGKKGLLDEVIYQKNGKAKRIVGFDKPLNAHNTKFVWRGKGLMGLLKSKWEVLYFNPQEQWAIIYFEKTLFTPAGYDVISQNKVLNIPLTTIRQKLTELGIKAELTPIGQN